MRVLSEWMREDVLSLIGPDAQTRRHVFDFIVEEMRLREHLARALHRGPVRLPGYGNRSDR